MRTENDVASFYMNFPMLSVLQKVEIGVSGVVHASVLGRELLFFVLAVLAAALVWAKRREWLLRAVSLMPCVLMVPLSLYQYELGAVVPWVKQIAAAYTAAGYISLANCNAPAAVSYTHLQRAEQRRTGRHVSGKLAAYARQRNACTRHGPATCLLYTSSREYSICPC